VWITRAQPGAGRTAERVRALGHTAIVAPLLQVRPLPAQIDVEGAGALAFTSINGVEAFAARWPNRDLPVFAVGDATAKAARAAGFDDVISADGDLAALARLIAAAPPRGGVLAPGAMEPAGALPGARAIAIYQTVELSPPAPEAEAVLLHSPRAAAQLARLIAGEARALVAYCISPAAAAPLADLPLGALAIAPAPTESALLALLPPAT
jgi:uroporphyrinogen-III synthase